MRKFLSLVMMAVLAIGAWAAEVTVEKTIEDVATANGWENSVQYTSFAMDDIITVSVTGGGNTGKYYTNGNNWRLYANEGATLNVAAAGATLKSITVTFTVKDNGVLLFDGESVASGTSVSVTGSSATYGVSQSTGDKGKVFVSAISVTYETEGGSTVTVAAPTFSPAAGEVEAGTAVTISADAEMIVYTTDGTTPSYANNVGEIYTEPIVVNEAMTIKAIAVDDDENESAVATAAYTIKQEGVTCATVAEIISLDDNTEFTFTGNLVVSASANSSSGNNYLYAQDATGGMLLFKATHNYTNGDVIPAGFSAKKTTYNGAPELTNVTGLAEATATQELEAEEMTPGDVTLANAFKYAIIKGARIENGSIVVGDESVVMYDRFGVTAPNDGNVYDVIGVTGWYNGAQYMPLEFKGQDVEVATPVITGETPFIGSTTVTIECETEDATIYYTIDGTEPTNQSTAYTAPFELTESATVKAIAYDATGAASTVASKEFVKKISCATVTEILALDNNTEFTFTGSMTTIAQALSTNGNSKYLYAQDEEGVGMLLFNAPVDYSKGDVIPAGWAGKITQYKGAPEVASITGMQAATETAELTAAEMTPAEVTVDPYNLFHYAVIKGASLVDGKIAVGEESVAGYYDRFGVSFPEDNEGKTYDIYGIPSWYNNAQFMPLEFVECVAPVTESFVTYVADQQGGTIAVSLEDGTPVESMVTKVAEGEIVTVTATAKQGYVIKSFEVKQGEIVIGLDEDPYEGEFSLRADGNTTETHTFVMPGDDVAINVVFELSTGIENINMENVKAVRYYNAAGVESATPFQGVNIVVREMTDGSKSVVKVVK